MRTQAALLMLVSACSANEPPAQTSFSRSVFTSGTEGYALFRIPTIVATPSGTLIAICEARQSVDDHGNIDLVYKRSFDEGRSWTPLSVLFDNGDDTAGNPAPVVDGASGRVMVLFVRAPRDATVEAVRGGEMPDAREGWISTSEDDGASWGAPVDITESVKDPSWRWLAFGPVHGIQLTHHDGRLVVPANNSTPEGADYRWLGSHLLYSDDGGLTFRIGATAHPKDDVVNPNESTVVELSDGRLLVNTRDRGGVAPWTRGVAHSSDGGLSYDEPFQPTDAFIMPDVQGALTRVGERLVFSGPAKPANRAVMQLRTSDDDGHTWTDGPVVHDGWAAYSDMVPFADGTIGVLFEAGDVDAYERITFTRLSPE